MLKFAAVFAALSLVCCCLPPAAAEMQNCSEKQPILVARTVYPFDSARLPYSLDYLEPIISAKTQFNHSQRLFAGLLAQLNSSLVSRPGLQNTSLVELIRTSSGEPQRLASAVYNHYLYWATATAQECSRKPTGDLEREISNKWLTHEAFETDFIKIASGFNGNGWAWLCVQDNTLNILTTPEETNPIALEPPCLPILAVDLWEHAYSYNFKTDLEAYVTMWLKLVDWKTVGNLYTQFAVEGKALEF